MTTRIVYQDTGLKNFFAKIYSFLALNITLFLGTSYLISLNIERFYPVYSLIFKSGIAYIALPLLMFLIIKTLSDSIINNSSLMQITALYAIFIAIEALLFAPFLIVFTSESIYIALGITSGIMILMSLVGIYTSIDLSSYYSTILVGLFTIGVFEILANLIGLAINIKITSMAVIVLIMVTIACETQTLQKKYFENTYLSDNKKAFLGSIDLFLDFVILVMRILIIMGRKKSED